MAPEQIRQIRIDMDLSIRAFADKLGVNKTTVVHWEQGRHQPKGMALRALERLAKGAAKKT